MVDRSVSDCLRLAEHVRTDGNGEADDRRRRVVRTVLAGRYRWQPPAVAFA